MLLLAGLAALPLAAAEHVPVLAPAGAAVELTAGTALEVRAIFNGQPGPPLIGRLEARAAGLRFVPALPLAPGRDYELRWRDASGSARTLRRHLEAGPLAVPTVQWRSPARLPANALKLYLEFSEPMEQGVFLERLRLRAAGGAEVAGPFRETELWSPDGRRLTVWLHPGRQKTGVNLNADEGPVLRSGQRYELRVDAAWRSTAGVPLGREAVLTFAAGPEDHTLPRLAEWRIETPRAGTRAPLGVHFDEPLDAGMLPGALQLFRSDGTAVPAARVAAEARSWTLHPAEPWAAGDYELRVDPQLEDLAGNSLQKPFEVDLQAPPAAAPAPVSRRLRLAD